MSLVLATTPASTMTGLDVARMRQLADQAARRLSAEPRTTRAAPVIQHRLSRAVAAAEATPTDHGLVIFVDQLQLAMFSLPFSPRDRVVVDPSFATRDLEYALVRYPTTRVIVLGRGARILEGRPGQWSEVETTRADAARAVPGATGIPVVDRLIDQRIGANGGLPLIVIGSRRQRRAFHRTCRHADTIAAEAHRGLATTVSVQRLADEAVAGWNHEQRVRSVAALNLADSQGQVTWGLHPTWRAISEGTAEWVWVEHDFARSGRVVVGPDGIELSSDPVQPGVIDDLVDGLIVRAHQRGIPIEFLDAGTLARPEPIAAKLRTPAPAEDPWDPHSSGTSQSPSDGRIEAGVANGGPSTSGG